LKRAIQKEIETPLGRLLLKGEAADGQTVNVDHDRASGRLQFSIKAAPASTADEQSDSMTSASAA
jgi:ATP-dependent Clp protease ATP-binding subunit ClpA